MKISLLFTATICCTTISLSMAFDLMSDEYINYINSQQSKWVAGRNFHDNFPVQQLIGVERKTEPNNLKYKYVEDYVMLPDEFDARNMWPDCKTIDEIGDEGSCAASWVFGAVTAMSDRICIHSNGKQIVRLSAENLLACCDLCGAGCFRGDPNEAWNYWQTIGIVSGGPCYSFDSCQPYSIEPCEHHMSGSRADCGPIQETPRCERECYNKTFDYKKDLHYGLEPYRVHKDEKVIRSEIARNGPVQSQFTMFNDFVHYKRGVYEKLTYEKNFIGIHSVKLLGWGTENDTKYWLAANSWNTDWGDKGYFKIIRGINHCDIEKYVVAALPKL